MFFKHLFSKARIYLDYASSTPVDTKMVNSFPRIPRAIKLANPSALHREGVALKRVLSDARALVAQTLGGGPEEIIFTSGATESDNLAVSGFLQKQVSNGVLPSQIAVYVSPFEHSAVKETVKNIDTQIRICELVQENGYVMPSSINLPEEIKVVLVSVIFVQNEIGTVQPIKEIAKRIRKLRKEYLDKTIVFHVDATQAPLFYDLNVARLGIDMMTLGATKLYCHKGVGILYKRRGIKIMPIMYGGGQEGGLRPGTEPVELIHEFTHSLKYAQENMEKEFTRVKFLQEYFEKKLKENFPRIRITGAGSSASWRTPHITHLVIPNLDSELLVIELDARGIAASSKSACKNEDANESELLSLLYPHEKLGAIRISYGRKTSKKDLNKTVSAIKSVLQKYNIPY
ncbi:MAG: aminotransferase class V-fold PLP-dependent enzyme [Patescibacteria group bacterium]